MFKFVNQLIAFLILAVLVLALMSAFGIGGPAADGLALLFGFIIWILVMGIILVFVPGIIMKMIANAGAEQPSSSLPAMDDTRTEEALSLDQHQPERCQEPFSIRKDP